jgi:hypothetical protein
VSNTLWAVATIGQQVPAGQLQQLLDALLKQLQRAKPQEVVNTLWACAKQRYLPQQLLTAPEVVELLRSGNAQELANAAWACGQLGHRDGLLLASLLAEVQQRLATGAVHDSKDFNSQDLCNTCWAAAVLDLQQHASQVLHIARACSGIWLGTTVESHQQLWQVHMWLLDFQLAGGQGLQGSLTEPAAAVQGSMGAADAGYSPAEGDRLSALGVCGSAQAAYHVAAAAADGATECGQGWRKYRWCPADRHSWQDSGWCAGGSGGGRP